MVVNLELLEPMVLVTSTTTSSMRPIGDRVAKFVKPAVRIMLRCQGQWQPPEVCQWPLGNWQPVHCQWPRHCGRPQAQAAVAIVTAVLVFEFLFMVHALNCAAWRLRRAPGPAAGRGPARLPVACTLETEIGPGAGASRQMGMGSGTAPRSLKSRTWTAASSSSWFKWACSAQLEFGAPSRQGPPPACQ
jgi:hypothetical protein